MSSGELAVQRQQQGYLAIHPSCKIEWNEHQLDHLALPLILRQCRLGPNPLAADLRETSPAGTHPCRFFQVRR